MDNNNPSLTTNPAPVATPEQPVAPAGNGDNSKMGLWMIAGVVLVFVIVGGIYWYLSNKQTAQNTPVPQANIPAPTPETNLSDELNSMDVTASASSEFKAVDSDISGL